MPPRDLQDVWVIPEVHFQPDATVKSRWLETPLRLVIERLPDPQPAAPAAKKAKKSADKNYEAALAMLPWLQRLEKGEWATELAEAAPAMPWPHRQQMQMG